MEVALTLLSPAVPGELAAYPGSLVGSVNGAALSLLQTFGVLDVTVTQNGQTLQVASGQTVTVTIPVAASGTLSQTQDLWSYNLATGIWDHEGTAQLVGSAYTSKLAHFSYYNIDRAIVEGKATCVTGLVVDKSGNPVSGTYVSPTEGASLDSWIQPDSNGRYCTWVLTGASETITADAIGAPYGEGSITVTGGAANAFPDSYPYTCSNLNCQSAPNIVLGQLPCSTNSDCPSGDTCCTVSGQQLCLESFACQEADGSGSLTVDGGSDSGSRDGGSGEDGGAGSTVTGTVAGTAFASRSGIGASLVAADGGYVAAVQLYNSDLSQYDGCALLYGNAFYSSITGIEVLVAESSPIATGHVYTLSPPPADGGLASGSAGGSYQATDSVCTITAKIPAISGSIEFTTISSSTMAGAFKNIVFASGYGGVSGSFNVPVCSSNSSSYDGGGGNGCETP